MREMTSTDMAGSCLRTQRQNSADIQEQLMLAAYGTGSTSRVTRLNSSVFVMAYTKPTSSLESTLQ